MHVFAIGKEESFKNSMLGEGVIPAGGSAAKPLANMRTSSRHTVVAFSKDKKSTF